MPKFSLISLVLLIVLLIVVAAGARAVSTNMPGASDAASGAVPDVKPLPTIAPTDLPPAVEYNLGDTTIVQSNFPPDSRFRNMPVRLNGLIAVPQGKGGPYPVVLIMHGNHPGCPVDAAGVDRWPCSPDQEQPNYRGFEYLVRELAARGYVALSVNINAENTFGFGEGAPADRMQQVVDKHLKALAVASAGGANDFGVDLKGRADVRRLVLGGHSRGAENAYYLAHQGGLGAADSAIQHGYGPVSGLLLIAAAAGLVKPTGSDVPVAAILPACDGDVTTQDGQLYFEGARLDPGQVPWSTSAWLERANHNDVNSVVTGGEFPLFDRPDCETLMGPQAQQAWLVAYAADFLTTVFGHDPQAIHDAKARLGMDARTLAPDTLYGQAGRVSALAQASDRKTLMIPASEAELTLNRVGGGVTADGVSTHFCVEGYYTPSMKPGSEPCKRANVTIPGNPSMAVVSWESPGAALKFTLPEGAGDLRNAAAISLRAAVDPLSPLNATGAPQALSVRLSDWNGKTATASTRPNEPALGFPVGQVKGDSMFGDMFTGRAPMTTIRIPMSSFAGVDMSQIREVALVFDKTPSGSLFLGDLELVRSPQ
ncbi:MAG: hypothetical protein U0822_02840 [Anaerolineae bacterium]